jgi:phage repressor protein C with HTH and peptisase S24 domain
MIKIVKVRGGSMRPTLLPGDYIIVTKARSLRPGFVILVDHSEFGVIVKRVKSINKDSLRLEGDGRVTSSTQEMGDVPLSNIIGRARWVIKPGRFKRAKRL